MYHHQSQQQGTPQSFSNKPRPTHQPPPNQQQQSRSATDILSQVLGFKFPPPTQLPDELESALAIRGSRDMDHRLVDHMNRPKQHQIQGSGHGIGQNLSEHGSYTSSPATLDPDNQHGHQQELDWSSYQQSNKQFSSPPPSASHQPQRHQRPQPQNSRSGTGVGNWNASVTNPPQALHSQGGGSGAGVDIQGLYTPESAGSILASFGLSNEDLEVLSHYPDDQLTPDTLPLILRDIQINKSNNQNNAAKSSSSYSQSISCSIHDMPPPHSSPSIEMGRSCSPDVPSILSVTQKAGKVIDYGHASRSKDDSSGRETFKREQLSNERMVKMRYPPPSSSSAPKQVEMPVRRHDRLETAESNKHGDQDYRRQGRAIHKIKWSPVREFPPSSKSRRPDQDYRHDCPKLKPLSETKSESSSLSRHSLSPSGPKPRSRTKKLPTPTMISDFSSEPPKVYPHTCSLCHIQCDQAKDWIDHVNTVNHTAACRDLRNKYPEWKPSVPSSQDGSRDPWQPKERSPSRSVSRSLSWSPTPSPPPGKRRVGSPNPQRQHGRPYPPRHQHHKEHSHHLKPRPSSIHSPTHTHRAAASSNRGGPERRASESSGVSTGSSSRSSLKRPHDDLTKRPIVASRRPFSSASRMVQRSKTGALQSSKAVAKMGTKPGTKMTKTASGKASANKDPDTVPPPLTVPAPPRAPQPLGLACWQCGQPGHVRRDCPSTKPPPAKKKKKVMTLSSQSSISSDCLVYLTGIPTDASEQEVTDLMASFGKINNVVLMPSCWSEGQKASVCMMRPEDAQALAHCSSLSIRDKQINASFAKKIEADKSLSDINKGKSDPTKDVCAAGDDRESEADEKTSDEKAVVLISGLPESGWSENDIIKLVQPFGTPFDIILAKEIGKVLVSLADMETAREMVKVHTFNPVKIKDSELKMMNLKQAINLGTPVALYNLLKGSLDPLETHTPVGWSSLLVISNVPDTPTGPAEVQNLVRRFGTLSNFLVLDNNNMIICEMATPAMALSVYKRFQKFPCIIQNNPLSFSRKADPKANAQTRVIAAYLDSSKVSPADGKASRTAPAAGQDSEPQEDGKAVAEGKGEENEEAAEKTGDEKMAGEDEAVGEEASKDVDDEVQNDKKDQVTCEASDSVAELDTKPDADVKTATRETAPVKPDNHKLGETSSPTGPKETTAPSSNGDDTASAEAAKPEPPKVSPEMVNTLLEECPTRTAGPPNQTAVSPDGERGTVKPEASSGGESGVGEKKKELINNKDEEKRKRKEREVKREKDAREKEKKEQERRVREREEKTRREKERREKERRERERREREKRERERRESRRTHREGSSGSRSSGKRSSRRDGKDRTEVTEKAKTVVEEDFDDFPFDMGDFVTVDEVGDEMDIPNSALPPPVSVETTEGVKDSPTSLQLVDEVGDVTDLPNADVLPLPVPMETTEDGVKDTPTSVQLVDEVGDVTDLPNSDVLPVPVETTEEGVKDSPTSVQLVDEVGDVTDLPNSALLSPPVPVETPEDGVKDTPTSLQLVDEVGDVTDLPNSALLPPPVPVETPEEGVKDTPTSVQLVDEVGDVTDLPNSALPPPVPVETKEDGVKDTPAVQLSTPEATPTAIITATPVLESTPAPTKSEAHGSEAELVTAPTVSLETPRPAPTPVVSLVRASSSSNQEVKPASQPEPEAVPETVMRPVATSDSPPESLPAPAPATTASPPEAALVTAVEADPSTENPAAGDKGEVKEGPVNHSPAGGEVVVVSERPEEEKKKQSEEDKVERAPAAMTAKREMSEDKTNEEQCVKKKPKTQAPFNEDCSLPPFDPNNPVGMEFLLPKTGFFCKVCNRFFTGNQDAEINHCKSLKHYESLQKYLQTRKTASMAVKPASS